MSDAKKMFATYVEKHEMTVLKDDGLYRHIRFQTPGSSIFWFDLITWPHNLVVTGDVHSYQFARMDDMFEFFTVHAGARGGINPGYWAEKIRGDNPAISFSEEKFKQQVVEYFMDNRHAYTDKVELWKTIRADVLDSAYAYSLDDARHVLNNFRYRNYFPDEEFEFADVWEWDLTDYDHHYLMACHAIVWGIAKYRAEVTARAA
ncbi:MULTISPECIES: hypothetical protein [Rhodococcus]|uniref:hypothetical protein n=1 Tax=Rhodococcus TaxID=1827 RepID=UPI0029555586|nr:MULTISPECIES: hypothetical protein [Rhodococcus]MDV7244510.1 hypothetical protein [Rhodococcus oxybenzonivorans]MDV7274247.1 hypothetical protein [Rhodococcus oxybenzonivorans]MDV7337867.1 hypothetical protein [Rhodococcus oxybenzonivorans]MDV7345197.1 hypothetical protein [Rhodococcus oxybenzonivorans]MDV8028886.1 hypothetical protein [Rhodococcus sp. IEGM 27]